MTQKLRIKYLIPIQLTRMKTLRFPLQVDTKTTQTKASPGALSNQNLRTKEIQKTSENL